MGLFSSLQEAFNSDIVYNFNYLYDNHYRGTKFFYEYATMLSPGSFGIYPRDYGTFSRNMEYKAKKLLVEYKSQIIDIDKSFVQEDHKNEIIAEAKIYPRAYIYFCRDKGIPLSAIYKVSDNLVMPGQVVFLSFYRKIRYQESVHYIHAQEADNLKENQPFYDAHFESLINKELDRFPRKSPDSSSLEISKIFKSIHKHSILTSLTPHFNRGMHGLTVHNGIVSVTFTEDKNISTLYPLLGQFAAKEKEIDELVKREHLWSAFEKNIILNKYGAQYYKSYFKSKYGTENVSLDAYEQLAKDQSPLNDYISKKEEPYRRLKRACPYGTEHFEKTHPEIHHSDYAKYESEINKLEVQSKYVKYPEHQTQLTSAIESNVSGKSSWTFQTKNIQCKTESFDYTESTSTCKMVHIYQKQLLDRTLEEPIETDLSIQFPHCNDILNNIKEIESITDKALLNLLTEILVPLIEAYSSVFKSVYIVLDEAVQAIIEGNSSSNGMSRLLNAITLRKKHLSSCLSVISTYEFRMSHPDHVTYIFVDLMNPSFLVERKLSELANSYLISSLISLYNIIDKKELCIIEQSRKEEEKNKKLDEIQRIKRDYPFGFNYFCNQKGISEAYYISHYSEIINSIEQIRQLQRVEDDRKREYARKQHEEGIIRQAHKLISNYPNIAKEEGFSSSMMIDYNAAQAILKKESSWKDIELFYYKRFDLLGVTESVSGIPHKYFYDYFPSKYFSDYDLTSEQRSNRSFIWGFKDGKNSDQTRAVEMVSDYINQSRLKPYIHKLVFVCSPASNNISNETRFQFFSNKLCQTTGMINGFEHIHITGITTPKHRGGNGCVEFEPDHSFFNGKFVLLFDDLVTSGGTISTTKRRLERAGARVIGIISLGQTKSNL